MRTNTHELYTQLDFMIYCTLSLIIISRNHILLSCSRWYTIMLILEKQLFRRGDRLESAEAIANINPLQVLHMWELRIIAKNNGIPIS